MVSADEVEYVNVLVSNEQSGILCHNKVIIPVFICMHLIQNTVRNCYLLRQKRHNEVQSYKQF